MFPNISLNRRMPNGTSGGVRGASNPSPYSIVPRGTVREIFFCHSPPLFLFGILFSDNKHN